MIQSLRSETEAVVRSSATKLEAAQRLGVTPQQVGHRVHRYGGRCHDLLEFWRQLPPGGAYSAKAHSRTPPAASVHQAEADALVQEALGDAPFSARRTQRDNLGRLMLAMFNISGTMRWPRGWTRAVMIALEAVGQRTSAAVVRWYRNRLVDAPEEFDHLCDDPELMADLRRLADR